MLAGVVAVRFFESSQDAGLVLKRRGFGLKRAMFTQFRCSKMRFLPENGKLKRVRVKKAEEGGSVERLKASLEKGKLLCGLGSSALCVACFGLRYLHRIRKSHVYAIFVPKRSADALVHSPMRQMYANIVAVSLRIHKRAAPQRARTSALRARCKRAARTRCGRAAGALRTRCGRAADALVHSPMPFKLKYDCSFIHTTGCVHAS